MVKIIKIKPRKIDVVSLYATSFIEHLIPSNTSVQDVTVMRNKINYVSSFSFFLILFRKVIFEKSEGRFKKNLLLKLTTSIIDSLNPSVIITRKDNAYEVLSHLTRKYPNKLVCAVQNGSRLSGGPGIENTKNCHIDTFFGFGDYEYDLIKSHGGVINNYFPVGSIKQGLFLSNNKKSEKKYDLCFVSHYSSFGYESSDYKIVRMYEIVNESLYKIKKISILDELLLVVAAVNSDQVSKNYSNSFEEESDLIINTGVSRDQIIPNDIHKFRTYDTCFSSEITIGVCSTVLFEMLGSGNKILFIGTGDLILNELMSETLKMLPEEIKVETLEQNDIRSKILNLINMSDSDYKSLTKDARIYYMAISNSYPHEVIKKHIAEYIVSSS